MIVLTITRARGKNARFTAHSELGVRLIGALLQGTATRKGVVA